MCVCVCVSVCVLLSMKTKSIPSCTVLYDCLAVIAVSIPHHILRLCLGGSRYEPHEDNPMLGWRGASR